MGFKFTKGELIWSQRPLWIHHCPHQAFLLTRLNLTIYLLNLITDHNVTRFVVHFGDKYSCVVASLELKLVIQYRQFYCHCCQIGTRLYSRWSDPVINQKKNIKVNTYRLLTVYRKIFGTSSYGEDARACECISAI